MRIFKKLWKFLSKFYLNFEFFQRLKIWITDDYLQVFGELDVNVRRDRVSLICLLMVVIGVISLISNFIQSAAFAKSGEGLTERVRQKVFRAMLQQVSTMEKTQAGT